MSAALDGAQRQFIALLIRASFRTEMRSLLIHSTLVFLGVLLALFFVELGLRAHAALSVAEDIELLHRQRPMPGKNHHSSLAEIIQISKNRQLIYELRPNLQTKFLNAPLRTNTQGLRSPNVPRLKGENVFRIVGLGDSVLFGWGVPARSSYLAQARRHLRKQFPDCRIEIINTAVPGYNGVMATATLEAKALDFDPDLVILGVVQNDLDLPNFIRQDPTYFSLSEIFLFRYLENRLNRIELADAPPGTVGDGFESNPHKVPAEYRNLVGEKAYLNALQSMQVTLNERNIPWLAVSHLELSDQFRGIFQRLDKQVVEAKQNWLAFAKQNKLDPVAAAQLDPGIDPHPSALLHRVVGKAVFESIRNNHDIKKKLNQCNIRE